MQFQRKSFRAVFLPYCLKRQEDGGYLILGRDYNPVGVALPSRAAVDDALHQVLFSEPLPTDLVQRLSVDGSADADTIYLYRDGSVPTTGAETWATYSERLELLASLFVEWGQR